MGVEEEYEHEEGDEDHSDDDYSDKKHGSGKHKHWSFDLFIFCYKKYLKLYKF